MHPGMRESSCDDNADRGRADSAVIEMRNTSASECILSTSFEHSDVAGSSYLPSHLRPTTGSLAESTVSNFSEQTLSNYLINNQQYTRLLSACGGLHIPMRLNYNDLSMNMLNVWRLLLIFTMVVMVGAELYSTGYELSNVDYRTTLLFLWPLCLSLQGIIVFPILSVVSARMKQNITFEMTLCIKETLVICRKYVAIALLLWVMYFAVITYFYVVILGDEQGHSNDSRPNLWDNIGTALAIGSTTSLGLLSISLLSTWAVFFMVLDAKTAKMEIETLIELTEKQKLTVARYNQAYARCHDDHTSSHRIADLVALVSYICVLSLLAVSITVNTSVSTKVDIVVMGFCALTREAILLLFVLPVVAATNAAMDKCSRLLAEKEWNQLQPHHYQNNNNGDVDSDLSAHSSNGLTSRNTLGSVSSINHIYANNPPNVVCLRLWALSQTKPIHATILGRAVRMVEMRAQFTAAIIMMIGSFGAYLSDTLYSNT